MIAMALKMNASDIHISGNSHTDSKLPYLFRMRVHGRLTIVKSDFIGNAYKEVIARIKVLANMDTTEARAAQDGQIDVEAPEGQVILRISTVPGIEDEDVVIRLQRAAQVKYSLDALRIDSDQKARVNGAIHQRSGLIILNGPAGSGKTRTIYSIIGSLASPEKKIITAEDPVEARLPYVSHNQVTPKTSFADLCRAFMRQDADLIFVGEVRDKESADAAIRLAQTGHMVITSLHTRDAVGVIARLEALEIDPNMISSSLVASIAQRLIPTLCASCRLSYRPDANMLRSMHAILPVPGNATFYMAGPGCPNCIEGFSGRAPVFEILIVDGDIADMINRKANRGEIVAGAQRAGMRTLAQDILHKVYQGVFEVRSAFGWGVATSSAAASAQPAPAAAHPHPAAPGAPHPPHAVPHAAPAAPPGGAHPPTAGVPGHPPAQPAAGPATAGPAVRPIGKPRS